MVARLQMFSPGGAYFILQDISMLNRPLTLICVECEPFTELLTLGAVLGTSAGAAAGPAVGPVLWFACAELSASAFCSLRLTASSICKAYTMTFDVRALKSLARLH